MMDTFQPESMESGIDRAVDTGRRVINRVTEIGEQAARAAGETPAKVADAGHRVGDAFAATTDYIRDHDLAGMVDDVKTYTRTHPVQALAGAAALGFLAALVIRRS